MMEDIIVSKTANSPRAIWTISLTFLVWAALVLAAYYVVQKPLRADEIGDIAAGLSAFRGAPSIAGLFDTVLNLGVAGMIVAVATAFGARMPRLPLPPANATLADRLEFWLIAAGVGLMAISFVAFGLALLGWLHSWLVFSVAIGIPLLVSAPALPTLVRDLRAMTAIRLPTPLTIAAVVMLGMALLTALAPPVAYDAWLYHLAVPQRALLAGQLGPEGAIIPSENYPMLMSSLYLLAMALQGDIAAQLLHFGYGILLLGTLALAARWYERSAVPMAVALALSMPMLGVLAGWAYTDLALAFYSLAAVYLYARWLKSGTAAQISLSAVMAAGAMGLKYTSFVVPLAIVLHLVAARGRPGLVAALRFGSIAAALAVPWYLKNWLFSGNPVYPFLFGGLHWDAWRAAWYAQTGSGIGANPLALLTMPFTVTLGVRDASFVDGRIGPLLLVVLPLLFVPLGHAVTRSSRGGWLRDPFIFVGLLWVGFWIAGVIASAGLWQARLLLPGLMLLIPPLSARLIRLRVFVLPRVSLHRLLAAIVALVLLLNLSRQVVEFVSTNPLAPVLGMETADNFRTRQWGGYVEAMNAINALPGGARLQFLWEPRTYLARRQVRADLLLDALPHSVYTAGSLSLAVQRWKAEGTTHALIFDSGARFAIEQHINAYTVDDVANLQRLRTEFGRELYRRDGYTLLELK